MDRILPQSNYFSLFSSSVAFKAHMKSHQLFHMCTFCERIFTAKTKLRDHLAIDHRFDCRYTLFTFLSELFVYFTFFYIFTVPMMIFLYAQCVRKNIYLAMTSMNICILITIYLKSIYVLRYFTYYLFVYILFQLFVYKILISCLFTFF